MGTNVRHGRVASLAATAVFLAGACAGQGGSTSPPKSAIPVVTPGPATSTVAGGSPAAGLDWKRYSGTKITFLADVHPWTDGMTTLLPQFTADTGIQVEVQPYSEDLYYNKLEQVVRAPTGTADVFFMTMDVIALSQFNAGLIEPLSPYLNDPTKTTADYDVKDFAQGLVDPGMYPPGDASAQLYGIPITGEEYILFYNKNLVDKHLGGTVPATFPELITAAQKVSAAGAGDGVVGAVMRGIRSDGPISTLAGVVYDAFGARDTPAPYGMWFDGAWTKPRLTDPDVCAGLTNYAKMLATGPSNKFAIDWPDANTLFSQGKAAFYIDASVFGPAFEDATKSQVAGKVGYAQIPPVTAGGTSYTGSAPWGLGIPKNAKNKDAAWYFIQWMTNKANTAKIGVSTGGAPRLSSYSDPTYTGKLLPEFISTVNATLPGARTTVVLKEGWRDGALAIVDGMLAIANGADPTAACAKANDALLKAVNK